MMKITGRVTSCCVALFLALTSVSAVHKKLDSINDLKKIDFGQSVPKHSLVLLHWFANTVDVDNNNVIWLTFDPNGGDYGSHHYGNFEGMLDQLPWGYRYYTIGNLYQETPMSLPSHVLRPQSLEYVGRNRDRIIIRVTVQNTGGRARQRIDRLYITQHSHDASYDPDHTYQITTNLLRQIREFSLGQNQQRLSSLRNRFGTVQRLKSINALKKIDFGQSVPKHSLLLLHWFANTVDIDNNNVIWLTFDPDGGDYGSHHYGNYEGLLDQLPWGYRYYTVGNLHQSTQLPSYVLRPQSLEYVGRNRDRIIIRVREQNTGGRARQRIDQVYITQHYDTSEYQGTPYDPDHTYQVTTNLLRQIREFSVGQNQQTLSYLRNRFGSNADDFYIRNTWGHLALPWTVLVYCDPGEVVL
ncbi:hypothetical protein L3Q82_002770 [Scortum barcoo]|uniref:Uncharacterized protein n=1 Tax=Scortum barcoo TaxID=214431 RepID=A0ACB8VUS6_9TELE|nr:hypothetical protein L3Q82_002770 [Scortum barcoo]